MVERVQDTSRNNTIKSISFHILSAKDIENLSVTTLDTKTLYDIESKKPMPGGALDLRLGVSTKNNICQTCNESLQNCAGHFGCVKLCMPVFHIGFLKHILTVLNCVCKSCGSLLIPLNKKLYLSVNMNTEAIKNECKKAKSCPKCNKPNGVVKKNTGFRIFHELKSTKEEIQIFEINPLTCLNIFNMISQEDYEYLGLQSNPANMIIQTIPVPPSCIRPSVDMNEEGFNEDDITVKISEIINTNKMLEESMLKGNTLPLINDDWDALQLQVALLINSDLPSINMVATPIRGLVQRLKGKNGRFRCNLSGKRVDFSGRTVISPDPNLSVEQVGIPERIAKILTVPETVTDFNKNFLTELVQNGVEKWPGANFIISKDQHGKEFKRFLMYGKNRELKIGDVVERHLLNDDILLFNRQPSLHRLSIMAHKAKIHKHRTFRFNECDCSPYNADFDGDEMNIHLPQTYEARAEAEHLMGIRHNICTPRNGEPLISCTQDFLTGSYLLSSKQVFFTRDRFAQLCMYAIGDETFRISIKPAIISPVELFTGKQLFELIILYAILKANNNSKNPTIDKLELQNSGNNHLNIDNNKSKSNYIIENQEKSIKQRDSFNQEMPIKSNYIIENQEMSLKPGDSINQVQSINPGDSINQEISIKSNYIMENQEISIKPRDSFNKEKYKEKSSEIFKPKSIENNIKFFVNLNAGNRSYKSENHLNEGHVLIINNRFLKGRLDKAIIGGENRKGSLIYQLLRISKSSAVAVMNAISRVSVKYLAETGFSIGLDDVYPGQRLIEKKNQIINEVCKKVRDDIKNGIPDLEKNISGSLSRVREECGNVCISELSPRNSPIIMQDCGSKGSKINVSQMIACVGQQIISGHRIPEGMYKRTLPHFEMSCMSPESRGFVFNSFFTGMHGYEFFFHAVSGREGLVDTAVKTAETGYMQRRLMKALEDLSVMNDFTVRNSANDLVQFKYGEDNIQPLLNGETEMMGWIMASSISKFYKICHFRVRNSDRISQNKSLRNIKGNLKSTSNTDFSKFDDKKSEFCKDDSFELPIENQKLLFDETISYDYIGDDFDIVEYLKMFINSEYGKDSRDYFFIDDCLRWFFNSIHSTRCADIFNGKMIDELFRFLEINKSKKFFHKGVFYRFFQNRSFINIFLDELYENIVKLVIEPGTAVGAIAGQSIGEPGTQMTLKTFHFAGVASMNITLGVPRLKEIINATAAISTPIITTKLVNTCFESAKVVKGRIEKIMFKDICNKVVYSVFPEGMSLSFDIDRDLVKSLRLEITMDGIAATINKAIKATAVEAVGDSIKYVLKRVKKNSPFACEKIRKKIMGIKVCGYENVGGVVFSKNGDGYDLLVEGTGLLKIFGTPGVEPYETISNNILEIEKVLGIEAARSSIIREVEYTMGSHGIKIDHRHVMLLSDTMCFRGRVLGITRFGIGKMRASTMMMASFEQTADYLFNAAVQDKEDGVLGVSESIILGKPISLGTGHVKLLWNEPQLLSNLE